MCESGYTSCPKCSGTGQWVAPISRYGCPSRCPDCYGTGSIRVKEPEPPADFCPEVGGPHNFQLLDPNNEDGSIRCVDCTKVVQGDDEMPAAEKPRGQVVRSFDFNKKSYRVVALGKHTAGYQDQILLQEREVDEVGGERWTSVVSSDKEDNDTQLLLLQIIANAKLP